MLGNDALIHPISTNTTICGER